jgi:thiamine biosynthesis lipoprotein
MNQFDFEAIGTKWQIDLFDELDSEKLRDVYSLIQKRIDIFDKYYSRFRSDSTIFEMSRKAGEYILPADGEKLLKLYYDLYKLTDGSFTPLIGQVMSDAGYDAAYSLIAKPLKRPGSWEEYLAFTKTTLTIKKPILLDFGAGGKGYLIDLVGEVLKEQNIHSFCIDAGGDILCHSAENDHTKPLRIGLENPSDISQVIGVAEVKNKSICGSAGNRRKWGEFHHLISPHTLKSPTHILATWVVADDTLTADALATALFFTSAQKLLTKYDFEYVVLFSDATTEVSAHFPGELFFER